VSLLRVELRRLLSRRAVHGLGAVFVAIILATVLGNYLHAGATNPLTDRFVSDGGLGFGGGFAALAFIVGATAGGAEWAARTMEALLVWEPRRVRLMLVKAAALSISVAAAAVVVQGVVGGLTRAAVAGHGSMSGAANDFWLDYVGTGASAVALAVFAALFGFTLASLTRNTGFALGAGVVYFVIIDRVLTLLPDWIDRFTLFNNITAFLNHGAELSIGAGPPVTLTTLRAGVTLTVYVAVLFAVATTLFNRRDVT
jgi:ABC-type transport system involved in multi-copper enzyme maturation permease subunit